MNNKRNIIVMFLFVMLSFAIISEVSAASDAEADGTGFDPSVKSVNMTNHDFTSERNKMQNHDNDIADEFKFHNEQNSFNNSPEFDGDKNIENENLYKHDMNKTEPSKERDEVKDFNFTEDKKPLDFNQPSDLKPMDMKNLTPFKNNMTLPKNDMKENIPNLMELNNITQDLKKDNNTLKPADKNSPAAKLPADKTKKTKNLKADKKSKKVIKVKKAKNKKALKKIKKSKNLKKRNR